MLSSMTGFASQTMLTNFGLLTIEIRSVNHRYLEPSFRIPELLRSCEPKLREQLQNIIVRGKVEINIRIDTDTGTPGALKFNEELALDFMNIYKKTNQLLESNRELRAIELMRFPNVISTQAPDTGYLQEQLQSLFQETLRSLKENRAAEGNRIQIMLEDRLTKMAELIKQAKEIRPNALIKLRSKLMQRIEELQIEHDPARLEQELVFAAQKMDIDEEIDRLFSHVKAMSDVFTRNEPVGRRLDFLTQEFNREANTLASKSQDIDLTQVGVELKVLIEQIREQIQNIE